MPNPKSDYVIAARKRLREQGDATVSQLCEEVGIPLGSRRREYLKKALNLAPDVYIDRWVQHETVPGNRHRWEPVFSMIPEDCPRPE